MGLFLSPACSGQHRALLCEPWEGWDGLWGQADAAVGLPRWLWSREGKPPPSFPGPPIRTPNNGQCVPRVMWKMSITIIKSAFLRSLWGFRGTGQRVFFRAFFAAQHKGWDQGAPAPTGRCWAMPKLHPGNGLRCAGRRKEICVFNRKSVAFFSMSSYLMTFIISHKGIRVSIL